jgi:site-specific recombinase XerD
MNTRSKNERLKRAYFKALRQAKGYAEPTIVAHERALTRWEEFTEFEGLGRYTANKAIAFKKYLESPNRQGKTLSAGSRYHCLQCLQSFFEWLALQPGFKSKITSDAISYLAMDLRTVNAVTSPGNSPVPSLEYVKRLTASIDVENEIGLRDRALIAFLLLSGMRDMAVATLPLGFFDKNRLEIRQDYLRGVRTKFGKTFTSYLLVFDKDLLQYIFEWVDHLVSKKLFANSDPLFPRTQVEQGTNSLCYEATKVEPKFWRGTGPIRAILRDRAKAAGLDYFKPHAFRHAHVHLALPFIDSGERLRAISKNLGHKHIATTLITYGDIEPYRVGEIIRGMDFTPDGQNDLTPEELKVLDKVIKKAKMKS